MFLNRQKKDSIVSTINAFLCKFPKIETCKARDFLHCGLHTYEFFYHDPEIGIINGRGVDTDELLSLKKAWSEFLERYSFAQFGKHRNLKITSNGFSSHTSLLEAHRNSLAELVERDVFLSCWLLQLPAIKLNDEKIKFSFFNELVTKKYKKLKINVEYGLFGSCMGFWVGAAFIKYKECYCLLPAAHQNYEELIEKLIFIAARTSSYLISPNCLEALQDFSKCSGPLDHMRYYFLQKRHHGLLIFISNTLKDIQSFPSFDYTQTDLTKDNHFALSTNFFVSRTISEYCQQAWFGKTTRETINFRRLSEIAGRKINYEELNLKPHPLP